MPTYYFHLYNDEVTTDYEGKDLPDAEAAQVVARANAQAIACAEVMEGHLNLSHRIDVANKAGRVLGTVRFADIVTVRLS
jgi:hypothetical protein